MGIEGNKKGDILAKQGEMMPFVGPQTDVWYSRSAAANTVNTKMAVIS